MALSRRIVPVVFDWIEVDVVDRETGETARRRAMVPKERYDKIAARQYHDGEEYPLVPLEARSRKSHNAYFAQLHEAFENLPEKLAARWPTEEHMRKWILVETGWFDEEEHEFEGPKAEGYARRAAAFARKADDYARIRVVQVADAKWVAIIRSAKSQAAAAMSKEPFEASKKDVLEWLEHAIGVARGTLRKEAGRHA